MIFLQCSESIGFDTRDNMKKNTIADCIQACKDCVGICTNCAAACTEEENVQSLSRCIQLNLECAAICNAAVQLMEVNGNSSASLYKLCGDICQRCAEECVRHAFIEHCRHSAEAARSCSILCYEMATLQQIQ